MGTVRVRRRRRCEESEEHKDARRDSDNEFLKFQMLRNGLATVLLNWSPQLDETMDYEAEVDTLSDTWSEMLDSAGRAQALYTTYIEMPYSGVNKKKAK